MIEVRKLTRRFGSVVAVNDVSFAIEPGTIVGFLGPNGAGKSTTMRLLAGYLRPDSGSATVAGHDVQLQKRRVQEQLGYLPETATGFAHLTVRQFLTFCAEVRGLWGKNCKTAIIGVGESTQLTPALDRKIGTLSKGWRQRAWFAQALLHDPPVLILDEPTDGLDPNQKLHIHQFLQDRAAHKTIILSTHNLEEAEAICGRVIIISEGRIKADAQKADLVEDYSGLKSAFHHFTGYKSEDVRA
ncbi:MAG: ABC transporter ATP-binding protein [Methyloligellaceae bacterium]